MRALILVPLLGLAACATTKECAPPGVKIVTQTVTKEVAKPCPVTKPSRPAPLAQPLPTDAIQLAAVLGAKLLEWAGPGGYGDRSSGALDTCIKAGKE
jgi:hypothetical protein